MILSVFVAIALGTLFMFVATWGTYGASMTGDQSWIRMAFVLGGLTLACAGGMIWSIIRLARRRTAFWVLLGPILAGLLQIWGFADATGDTANMLAWFFPWHVF